MIFFSKYIYYYYILLKTSVPILPHICFNFHDFRIFCKIIELIYVRHMHEVIKIKNIYIYFQSLNRDFFSAENGKNDACAMNKCYHGISTALLSSLLQN